MPSKIASRYDLAERLTEDDFIWRWGSNILPKILPSKKGKQKKTPASGRKIAASVTHG